MTAPALVRALRWPSTRLPRAAGAVELLDRPGPFPDLAQSLRDIERLNALFGGRRVTVAAVARVLRRLPGGRPATVLDVGTGSADIPRALVRWARRTGRRLRVLALDRDPAVLRVAQRGLRGYPEISLVRGDALELPLGPGGVDVAISALTLHHLEPGPAAAALAGMHEVARVGLVVNDLARHRIAHAAVWLATRLFARSSMSRHDGPLSVRRAYTPPELQALARGAGLLDLEIRRHHLRMRLCAVLVKR